jgi:CheY-like chemotaxis protein
MMDKIPKDDFPPVRTLFADTDEEQIGNIRLYARYQHEVNLCGTVCRGNSVLDVLHGCVIPDVLVLDDFLQNMNLLALLEEILRLKMKNRPVTIVTVNRYDSGMCDRLSSLGADSFLAKPYRLSDLFHTVVTLGTKSSLLTQRRLHEHINWYFNAMQADFSSCGTWYLRCAVEKTAACDSSYAINQIYDKIAAQEHVTSNAVATGIRRAIQQIQQMNTEQYCRICSYYGTRPGGMISNAEMIGRLAQLIRHELGSVAGG